MSEHEWSVGDWALVRVQVREAAGGLGVKVEVPDAGGRSGVYVNPADLIPDDRHRTPIAPQDVREGDVVRLEHDGTPEAIEGVTERSRADSSLMLVPWGCCIDQPDVTLYLLHRAPTERDKWWPPQPGDQISDGVGRVTRGRADDRWWPNPDHPDYGRLRDLWRDVDVPDDAVLILPAQTREATS